ncbi:MAG: hypothetical protein CM1200mP40_34510 [Gammaproteobacteria bacterium]|nr:MAG: hypothetical protein CM1200mP40_34510 [Gammaproteobacteria bacterium]
MVNFCSHDFIQTQDFNIAEEYLELRERAGDAGAIVTFTGLVREIYDHGNPGAEKIQALTLEHYPGMTEKALQSIVDGRMKSGYYFLPE